MKIFRQSQVTGKIPLQVFDRSGGVDNVRFEGKSLCPTIVRAFADSLLEYDALDANIAAELVIRAKSTHLAPPPGPVPGPYNTAPSYGAPQYGQAPQNLPSQQPQPAGANPNLANLITSMDGPALQKLLGAMAQNPQTPQSALNSQSQTPQQAAQIPDLAALLGNVNRQQPQQGYAYAHQQQSQPNTYPVSSPNSSFTNQAALSSLFGNAGNRPPPQGMVNQQQQIQPGQPQQPHVQNIMEQLARWKQ